MNAVAKSSEKTIDERADESGFQFGNTRAAYCETCGERIEAEPADLGEIVHTFHIGHDVQVPADKGDE